MTAFPENELLPAWSASSPRDTRSPRDNADRHRPMRKSAPLPANDAAGRLAGTKFKGGSNPSKGPGHPPPEKKEAKFVCGRKLVAHETMADHRAMLTHGLVTQPYQDEVSRRSMRHVQDAAQSHFVCSSLELMPSASSERKPMKGVGASHPNERLEATARVFCVGDGDDAARPHSALPTWAVTMHQAKVAAAERPVERPRTAPPTASRVQYQACAAGHADVFQYRHSGGICPQEYKLDGGRVASPVVCSADATTSKSAFWAARQAYSYNRVRSNLSFLG